MNNSKMKNLKKRLISCAWILGTILIMYIFKIPCLIKWAFGIECPGCGITRAYISLFRLDLKQAFMYNRMFWVVPFCFLFYLFDGQLFKNKWVNVILEGGMYLLLILNWIFFKL